jgi:16S rRNA (guanine527-N7)-methyltransferase
VLSAATVSGLLQPFELALSPPQVGALLKYLDLLLKWNRKINLTSVTKPEEIVQRHFGESFYLSRALEPQGKLLDIGSGAGFPGLALKILFPELAVTLLEPVAKKRVFLKEVARACAMADVEVLADRLDAFAKEYRLDGYDVATARAVGQLETLIPLAAKILKPDGHLALWLGADQVSAACKAEPSLDWSEPVPIPLSNHRIILVGRKA